MEMFKDFKSSSSTQEIVNLARIIDKVCPYIDDKENCKNNILQLIKIKMKNLK